MADNSWNELVASVNGAIGKLSDAASRANGASVSAQEQTQAARDAAQTADAAALRANDEAAKWEGVQVNAVALDAGAAPTCTLSESGGVKVMTFGLPRGETGPQGAPGATGPKGDKGDTGRSGVTFSLSGSVLTITTG